MMRLLEPTYTFRVTLKDKMPSSLAGSSSGLIMSTTPPKIYKFFDGANDKIGCDEAMTAIKKALSDAGLQCEVWFEKFEHT